LNSIRRSSVQNFHFSSKKVKIFENFRQNFLSQSSYKKYTFHKVLISYEKKVYSQKKEEKS